MIWTESEVGIGSKFHFTIPLRVATVDPVGSHGHCASRSPKRCQSSHSRRQPHEQANSGRLAEELGNAACLWSRSGEEALARIVSAGTSGDPFELILTDMHMPAMDGFDLVEQIQQKAGVSAATIMMLTSGGRQGDVARCGELGIAAYLLKPVRKSELHEAIARVLVLRSEAGSTSLITHYSLQGGQQTSRSLDILLAEDNPVNQKLAARLLEKRGHRVIVTSNGREALSALSKRSYDLVLMDVQMPEMDGLETTMALRAREKDTESHLPVVAMTALVMKGDRERCMAAGMDGYLSKPIRTRELDEMLDHYAAQPTEISPRRTSGFRALPGRCQRAFGPH